MRLASLLTGLAGLAAALPAQQFRPTRALTVPVPLRTVAIGDVDRDGHPDLVVGNVSTLTLLLNDGRGGFREALPGQLPQPSNIPGDPASVADLVLADLDGDGDLDLVVAHNMRHAPQIYRNDGAGTFTDVSATALPAGSGPLQRHLAVDVDGDGDLDLLVDVANAPDRLLLNDGTGSFGDVTATHLTGLTGFLLAVGDVDGDGDADLLVGPAVQVWQNDGQGRFAFAYLASVPWALSAALVDVDGDGILDLVARGMLANSSYLALGQRGGGFAVAANSGVPSHLGAFALADIDLDGDLDVVGGMLLRNDGGGRFIDVSASRLPAIPFGYGMVWAADLDRDGDPEILLGASAYSPPLLLANHHRHVAAPAAPAIGTTFSFEVFTEPGYLAAPALAMPFAATAPASIEVPGLGWVGLLPGNAQPLPWLVLPAGAGTAAGAIAVPNLPTLVGLEVFFQAILLRTDGSLATTNAIAEQVQ